MFIVDDISQRLAEWLELLREQGLEFVCLYTYFVHKNIQKVSTLSLLLEQWKLLALDTESYYHHTDQIEWNPLNLIALVYGNCYKSNNSSSS